MKIRPKILIVDDERFNINVLSELLKPNYKIMAAVNGAQALKAAQSKSPPDLILLDIMMPEMNGYEVCQHLKAEKETRDIPVIFVTAMGQESDEIKGLEVGAVDFLTKPISPAIVEARVKTHLTLRQSMIELESAKTIIEDQKNRMQDELNVGRRIQLSMLPQDFPAFPDRNEFNIHALMHAAMEVGGDFYDFFFIDDAHLCVCIGDVSGKGVPAALFMAIAKALIKSRATHDFSTASILTHVNEEMADNNDACMFVTIFLGIINIRTGHTIYTNAGHNPPYIKRRSGSLERMDQLHGPVVGVVEGYAYKEDQTTLMQDDLLYMYTDGVTEAMNPEHKLFEEKRLVEILKLGKFTTPDDLLQNIFDAVKNFANGEEQSDDITMLGLLYSAKATTEQAKIFQSTIPNQLDEIDRINNTFQAFADQHNIGKTVTQKVKLMFDELLNNIISYGYNDNDKHQINIKIELLEERITVTIDDDGIPFNPLLIQTPDTTKALGDREIGGLGIYLVREFMDEVAYKRGIDKNSVTLIKHLHE